MDLKNVTRISASALQAQSLRMRVIAENLANAESVASTPGGTPYQRKLVLFSPDRSTFGAGVEVAGVRRDTSSFTRIYQPGHPAADASGYVLRPNVSSLVESADMKAAQRSYEANLNAIEAARSMTLRTLDLIK
jgi:flagellar basal-body rod protein FlgC